MKRILTLLVVASMALSAGVANAAELRVSGQINTVVGYDSQLDFNDKTSEEHTFALTRLRTRFQFIANENLRGIWEVQVGEKLWGDGIVGNTGDFKTRLAYIDFVVPNTALNITAGLQWVTLPSVFGSPIFDARSGAVTVGGRITDGVNVTGFWARPKDQKSGTAGANDDDFYGVMANLDLGMAKIAPYALYGVLGNGNGNGEAYWVGANVELGLSEALSVKFDAMYGDSNKHTGYDTDGYMVVAAVDYEMPFGTPGVFGWYASGNDKKGKGVMPTYAPSGFGPTRFGFDGNYSIGTSCVIDDKGVGTAGVGLQLADMSFIDRLSHTARVAYVMGTSNKKSGILVADNSVVFNQKTSFIEVNFDSNYEIMENLVAVLELGVILPDFEYKVNGVKYQKNKDDAGWNAQLGFNYTF